jgi:asparagine synthase (glutamine-hydrolysing)
MLMKNIDKFIWHQEEPNNGTSYFAEFMLRSLIRDKNVTVSLEGQGADEIITGYKSLINPYMQDLIKLGKLRDVWNEYHIFKRNLSISKLELIGSIMAVACRPVYKLLRKQYMRHIFSHLNWRFINREFSDPKYLDRNTGFESALNETLYKYLFYTSIPPQLVRADKSAMAYSVECRFPFLDYRLVEFAFNLPFDLKIRNGVTKYVLREAMKRYLPAVIYRRYDKKGFPTPQKDWFKGSMKQFISDTVYSKGFKNLPFINWKNFEKKFNLFQKDEAEFDTELWSTMSIYLWKSKFIEKHGADF